MARLNITRVTFTGDDPFFGTWLAGDVVNIFWESTTGGVTVEKNSIAYPETGAEQIIMTNDFAGSLIDPAAFRTVARLIQSFCVGTTNNIFDHSLLPTDPGWSYYGFNGTNAWPYVIVHEVPDANSCAVSPIVSDLAWSGLPIITHSTSATSSDGAISFQATSSWPIYYANSSSFTSNWDVFPDFAGNYSGLSPGSYRIRARDSKGFTIAYEYEIINLASGLPPPTLVIPDINFPGVPDITTDTGPGDGSINFPAASSYPPIEYALRDFAYGDGSGQASPIFAGLRANSYTLFAIDSKNCRVFYNFTVPLNGTPSEPPASPPQRQIKYQLQVSDYNGKKAVVNILRQSYDSTATQVDGGSEDPIVYALKLVGTTDKFTAIMASTLTLTLNSVTPFQFLEIFQADTETYRVQYYQDSVLKLVAKIYPQSYQEPYTEGTNYPVTFMATCGLAELGDQDFVTTTGARYAGVLSEIKVIALALKKINFNLNIRVACNIYATGMASAASDDPLAQAFVDLRAYYPKNEALSCLEVLRRILEPYCASICQWGGYWYIVRFEECISTSVPFREFDADGDYVSNSSFNPLITVGNTEDLSRLTWADNSTSLDMVLPYGNVEVTFNQGLKKSLIHNGEFLLTYQSSPFAPTRATVDLTGFTLVQNGDTAMSTTFVTVDSETNGAIQFTGVGKAYLMASIPSFTLDGQVTLKVRCKTDSTLINFPYQKVKVKVQAGSHYLQADGTWTTTDSMIVHYVKESGKYIDLKTASGFPTGFSGDLKIRVYSSYVFEAEFSDYAVMRTRATVDLPTGFKTEFAASAGVGQKIRYFELENNTAAEYVPDIIRPSDYNLVTNPYQWILKDVREYYLGMPAQGTTTFDEIKVTYSPSSDLVEASVESLSPQISKSKLSKTLYHGSVVETVSSIFSTIDFAGVVNVNKIIASNANSLITAINYLRSSAGVPYLRWKRDAVAEDHFLQSIVLRSYAAQYKVPSRRLTGSLSSRPIAGEPVYLTPISVLKENYDGKFYKPMGYSYHTRPCMYSGEFIELVDITSGGTSTTGGMSSFSSSFNTSYGS